MEELQNLKDIPFVRRGFGGSHDNVADIRGEDQRPSEQPALSKGGCQHAQTEPLLNSKKAAEILGVSERTLFGLTARGEIPRVVIGRSVRYDLADLRVFVASKKRMGK